MQYDVHLFPYAGRSGKLDTSALLKEIQRVLSISEVTAACCNHDIQPSAFKNVQLLQSGDSGASSADSADA